MKKIFTVLAMASIMANTSIALGSDEIVDEITERCKKSMSQYGWSLVEACINQDIEAYNALTEYDYDKYGTIIDRCTRTMAAQYGWALTKACVDQDIAAKERIDQMR